MSCLECVWHLIRVHLCRIGPEGPRRPSVLAVAESVQRLPEVSRTKLNLLFYEIQMPKACSCIMFICNRLIALVTRI